MTEHSMRLPFTHDLARSVFVLISPHLSVAVSASALPLLCLSATEYSKSVPGSSERIPLSHSPPKIRGSLPECVTTINTEIKICRGKVITRGKE